jgi:orotate phosphoribosyltransferase
VSDGLRSLSAMTNGRKETISALIDYLGRECSSTVDTVVSSSTPSLFVSSLLAQRLGRPLAYFRQRPKTHGLLKQVEGKIRSGDNVLLISAGNPTEENLAACVGAIDGFGAKVVFCLFVEVRDASSASEWLRRRAIPHGTAPEPTGLVPGRRRPPDATIARSRSLTEREESRRRVARALLDVGAVTINRQTPFRYASGLLSPIYTDCRLLMSDPVAWSTVVDAFVEQIGAEIDPAEIDVLAGTATSGIPHASLIADRLELPMVYVTIEGSEDSPSGHVEGEVKKGDMVVMIEDHISTGKSVLSSADVLRDRQADVKWCFAIFTYGTPLAHANFRSQNITLVTLCDIKVLLNVAIESGRIGVSEEQAVESWLSDPQLWTNEETVRQNRSNATAHR